MADDAQTPQQVMPTCECGEPTVARVDGKPGHHFLQPYLCCGKDRSDPSRCGFFVYVGGDCKEDETPQCLCGKAGRMFQIKKEGANQGKQFYACSLPIGHPERCAFWQLRGGPDFTPATPAPPGVTCICRKRAVVVVGRVGWKAGKSFYICADRGCSLMNLVL